MHADDPLIRLLQSADAAANPPRVAAELPQRVRRRQAAQAARTRRIAGAAMIAGAVAIAFLAIRSNTNAIQQVSAGSALAVDSNTEVQKLLAEANTLTAEADALQKQVNRQREGDETALNQASYLRSSLELDLESATDRAASIKICQGDFYRDVQQADNAARAAYQSVLDRFPNSQWANVAREKLNELSMN